MNPRSGRTIPMYFKVSPEEKEIIDKKMELLGTHNQRAYLRKMAVDGFVVRVDMTDVKELAALLRTCSNNLNQIARRVNSTGNLYEEDIADLKTCHKSSNLESRELNAPHSSPYLVFKSAMSSSEKWRWTATLSG